MTVKIQVSRIYGIEEVEEFDEYFDEITKFDVLLSMLDDLDSDTVLYAEVTYDQIKEIEKFGYRCYKNNPNARW
jgi:hypothetical protein